MIYFVRWARLLRRPDPDAAPINVHVNTYRLPELCQAAMRYSRWDSLPRRSPCNSLPESCFAVKSDSSLRDCTLSAEVSAPKLSGLATITLSLRDGPAYPTSQQAGIGLRSSSSRTTIRTKARQRIKAHRRPEPSFGTTSVGSHGNMFVTYRPRSIPFVSACSPLEGPNAASHAAQTGDSVRFSSPHTGH
jgi:hypothetical protein